ncbi:type I-B CRISPR-associated endonuclease Cas1b [Actinomadura atramentaria]|uniref:type I-B CRISPR-associated endonuclease Cas1b n=1 Tax=Actinomadura atramentaria TaxID=1990 RepID=UPI00039AF08D|nr:type I-B CRISPR-associated endonuclease Cas1b [Actinomadura atramentaria]
MPTASRTYWLTGACRIRRKDQSLLIERESGGKVHVPVTDVRDIVACSPVEVNTAVTSLLNRHRINIHLLGHYGDYAGSLLTSDVSTSGETVLAQARVAMDADASLGIARDIVVATAHNVRRVLDRELLAAPYETLKKNAATATTTQELMNVEGNFRRSAWAVLDTKLPDWLQLNGRSRRPPKNAGNAFISYANGMTYTRVLTALRLTPLHTGIGFLHSTMERHRHTLVLDLYETFRPLFAERLLLRLANRGQLKPEHFDADVNQAMLSEKGRALVVQTIRDELETTIQHRALKRKVAYEELLYLEALRLTRHVLEGEPYKPFRIWW